AFKASKSKQAELGSVVEQLTSTNKVLTTEVHLCWSKVNALTKRVENSDNLQKIALTALEAANKKKTELKAKVEELTSEVADLKQWLEEIGPAAVDEYIAHFHETAKYDGLRMYSRGVAYNEVFKRLVKLYPELDLASMMEEFIPAEPSTFTDDKVGSKAVSDEGNVA
ncbi:Hypothetical predicted protein, partial [Olea europaea subsp. europaea]